jgi:hypothetical protein
MGGEGDKGYLLTSVSHRATDPSQLGEPVTFTYTVSVEPSGNGAANTPGALLFRFDHEPTVQGGIQKGDWITDVTYESVGLLGQPTIATETLTIAHEGFFLV